MKDHKPSSTAWLIGAATLFMAHDPALGKLVPPEAVQPTDACIRAAGGWKRRTVRFFGRPWFRRLVHRYENRLIPGFMLHLAARKRAIEDAARRAHADGFRQVIVLGAGYDTLALRLHREFPKLACIEVDQAATQRIKLSKALTRDLPSPTLALVSADLARQDLREVLANCPVYKPALDTLFIAEGLLMYLSEESVSDLFAAIREHGGGGGGGGGGKRCRVAFTFLEPGPDGLATFPGATDRMERWLERNAEPFRWGIKREQIAPFLASRGFTSLDVLGPQSFRQRYLAGIVPEDRKLAAGEFVCIADRK